MHRSRKATGVKASEVQILYLPPNVMLKVYETKTRSLLKAISFRFIEIAVDTVILSFFVTPVVAVGLAIALEVICFVLHFAFERGWNKINYGRHIYEKAD